MSAKRYCYRSKGFWRTLFHPTTLNIGYTLQVTTIQSCGNQMVNPEPNCSITCRDGWHYGNWFQLDQQLRSLSRTDYTRGESYSSLGSSNQYHFLLPHLATLSSLGRRDSQELAGAAIFLGWTRETGVFFPLFVLKTGPVKILHSNRPGGRSRFLLETPALYHHPE